MYFNSFAERLSRQDSTLSVDVFEKYLLINPYDYDTRYFYALFLKSQLTDPDGERNIINFKMLKNAMMAYLYCEDIIDIESTLAEIFRLSGDFDLALLFIQKSIDKYGDNSYILYLKGYNLMELKKYEDAIIFLEKSLSIEEDSLYRSALNYSLEMLSSRTGN